ncbi:MAG: VOC family protein [Bacteroidota bacterium]|nr:VOC family protein [Bacteroidota bacterium]MDP4225724.1 VOC family protein [Bacteroidota bacterium]
MKETIISGIQQIGIGVSNIYEARAWYRKYLGMDIKIFEEKATADIMQPYTGGQPRKRHAMLAINVQGGGGFEIWQYEERIPLAPKFQVKAGDLGIFAVKIKSKNVQKAYNFMKDQKQDVFGFSKDPLNNEFFYVRDPFNNIFEIVTENSGFKDSGKVTGGVWGAIIGVSDIEKALQVYSGILGYDKVVFDETGKFDDLAALPGGGETFRRVMLKFSKPVMGAFSHLLGPSTIELLQVNSRTPEKIYKERFWGDLGFIHLCYDIHGFEKLKGECKEKGFPFTVDSTLSNPETFNMGVAAGSFSYIEDPDGTLIEFVETHRIPIIKKLGWYIDLRKRNPFKSLPDWLLGLISFSKFK